MDKFKYQILVIIVCFCIGGFLGHLFTAGEKNKQIKKLTEDHKAELTREIEASKKNLVKYNSLLEKLEALHKSDSLQIITYKEQIVRHTLETEKRRKEATKLNKDEKKKFIIDYYKSN